MLDGVLIAYFLDFFLLAAPATASSPATVSLFGLLDHPTLVPGTKGRAIWGRCHPPKECTGVKSRMGAHPSGCDLAWCLVGGRDRAPRALHGLSPQAEAGHGWLWLAGGLILRMP